MQTVILAAGKGSRLKARTKNLPKGLIEVGGESLLSRSLHALEAKNLREIIVVTGFEADRIEAELPLKHPAIDFQFVRNGDFGDTGSMVSLALTAPLIGAEDFLLLEADLLYDPRFLDRLLNGDGENILLTACPSGSGDEVYVLADTNGQLDYLGKAATPEQQHSALGEFAGMSRISRAFFDQFCDRVSACCAAGDPDRHYEEVFLELALSGAEMRVHACPGLVWGEVDTEADLTRARDDLLPSLTREA